MSHRGLALLACCALGTTTLADTLVLRSGRRLEGDLVGARGGSIEFAEYGGSSRRYDRSEISRIEFGGTRYSDDRGSRPAGVRERTTSVAAGTQWNDTGIEVRSGMDVYFEGSGKLRWGPDRQHGVGGEGGSRNNPNRPIPNRPGGALIGRIGDSAPFFIGDERGPIRMRESGRLSLGVNDDYLEDNSGSWRVTIYY